jgi:transmembrane sensor
MEDNNYKALLQSYISGTLSEADREQFLNKLAEMPPHEADLVLHQLNAHIAKLDQTFLDVLEERLRGAEQTPAKVVTLKPRFWWSAAAAVLILFSATWIVLKDRKQVNQPSPTQYISLVNPEGKRNKVTLEDGTVVWLNAASTLKYPHHFSKIREVYLSGEAFFEVHHDEKKPFLVHTPHITTQVLGTSFNIYAFKNESEIVTVNSGKVHVGDQKGNGLFLVRNQRSIYNGHGFNGVSTIDASGVTSWTNGTLNFNGKKLKDVTIMLKRWYGVTLKIENDKIGNMVLAGEHTNESLRDVLETLSFALHIKYRQRNNEVILYK